MMTKMRRMRRTRRMRRMMMLMRVEYMKLPQSPWHMTFGYVLVAQFLGDQSSHRMERFLRHIVLFNEAREANHDGPYFKQNSMRRVEKKGPDIHGTITWW